MKRVQERIGLGEITLEDERKPSEKVPEQLDESLAFGTVLGAPAWRKPVHDPSRPTAAALAPAGAATGVALAERPPDDGDDGADGDDDGEAPSDEVLLPEELTIGDIEDAERDGAGDDESSGEDETAAADEEPSDVEEADEPDADDEPAKD
jgi:hypothetical protein